MQKAVRTGVPVVVDSLTTESRLVRANPSGTLTAEVNPGPVRVKAADGSWRHVDLTLVQAADGTIGPRVTPVGLRLSGGGNRDLVRITDGDASLGLDWPEVLPTPTLTDRTATYPEVLPGVDLVVRVGVEGFSTFVVVKDRAAAANPAVRRIRYLLDDGSLTTSAGSGRSLSAVDGSGKTRFRAGAALAWDSHGVPPDVKSASHVLTDLPDQARQSTAVMAVNGDELTVTPDPAFLDDPQTSYPLVIDPAVQRERENVYWTMLTSEPDAYPNHATEHARVGYNGWEYPYYKARSFYRFYTSAFVGKTIVSATFKHKLVHSPNNDCTLSTWGPPVQVYKTKTGISDTTVWDGPDVELYSPTETAKAHGNSKFCPGYDPVEWNVKDIVNAAGTYLTLGMKSSDESNKDGWRKFDNDATWNYPLLTVEYNSLPDTPSQPTLDVATGTGPSGFWVTTDMPTLKAKVTDPDGTEGGQIKGYFKVFDGSTPVAWGDGSLVNSGGTSVWPVPAGKLLQNKLYTVRVYGKDYSGNLSAEWSPYIQFRADWTAPNKPTVATPADIVAGSTAVFNVTSDSADVRSYCYSVRSDTASTCVSTSNPAVPTTVTTAPIAVSGPAWITVFAKDQAGTQSGEATVVWFEVMPNGANHRWRLDGDGSDSATTGPLVLTATGSPSYGDGRFHPSSPEGDGTNDADKALVLDGTSQFAQASGPAVTTGSDVSFSVAAWVKMRASTSGSPTAVSQLGSNVAGFSLGATGGKPSFTVRTADGAGGAEIVQKSGVDDFPVGQWVHLVGVYSHTQKKAYLYVNGQPWAERTVTAPVINATGPLTVGRAQSNAVPSDYWPGEVDDVVTFPGVIDINQVRIVHGGG